MFCWAFHNQPDVLTEAALRPLSKAEINLQFSKTPDFMV
jgi:hypothetical protein